MDTPDLFQVTAFLSLDINAVWQVPKQSGKCLLVFFFGDCFQLWIHYLGDVLDTRKFVVHRRKEPEVPWCKVVIVWWAGQELYFLSFKLLSYNPHFVGSGFVLEEDILGGGDWILVTDLLDDFGQTVSV